LPGFTRDVRDTVGSASWDSP